MLASNSIEIVGIYLSDRIRTKSGDFIGDVFRIINASGLRYAIYLALGTLIFGLFRKQGIRPTIQSIAQTENIEVFSDKDINSPQSLKWLKNLNPEILFSGFFNQKLGAEALSIPSLACLNLHPALLPKYKGVDPAFYYFLNNEKTLGVTLHRMDTTYDTGEILNSLELDITEGRSVFWHNIELFKAGIDLLIEWVEQPINLLNSKSGSIDSSKEQEFYDSWPTPGQVSQLKAPLFSWRDFQDQAIDRAATDSD